MKSKKSEVVLDKDIVPSAMNEVLIGAFERYAKAVITDRAIPDARDGLKPVQRRIIFDMFDQGNIYEKPTVKCATIVGHVMGHYHPHGDSSIYDALVHLSQSWKMEAPLVDFQGNNGSIDDDPAAAYRYTEARLSKLSEFLVSGIEKNTVEMVPTFDDKSLEPVVLPARFPNLLVNGTSGIAVGSTTYIAPNNLHEVVQATVFRIENPESTLDDILEFIPGPDFPTGGILDDREALRTVFETGRGSYYLYCKTNIDHENNEIHITEIPYGIVKIDFVAALNKRKDAEKLDNIEEIVDESAKDDIDIILKIKENASPEDVLNYLETKGALRNTVSCNFLAIDKGHPKTMSLIELIDAYIDHQREIQTKSSKFDLAKDQERREIVDGLMKAYSIVDELIGKIKKCSGKEDVKRMLAVDYSFTPRQAEAIAMLPLYRLSNTDITALKSEKEALDKDISRLSQILDSPKKLDNEIIKILKEVDSEYSTPRKTQILDGKQAFQSVDPTKLIAKEDVVAVLTADGYAKRSSLKSFQSSADANPDDPLNLPKIKPGDSLAFCRKVTTHDGILFFTDKGNYGYLPVFQLSDSKWKEEGTHLNNLLTLKASEHIVKAYSIDKFFEGVNVVLLTKENKIKRVALKDLSREGLTKKPLRAIKMADQDDAVVGVSITGGNSDVLVVDSLGRCSRYNEGEIPLVSTSALGVKAIASGVDHAPLVSLESFSSKEASLLLVLSSKRAARIVSSTKIECTNRLGPKTPLVRVLKKNAYYIIAVEKVEKIKGQKTYAGATTAASSIAIDLSALDPVELNAEMRENIPGLDGQELISFHDLGTILDPSTILIETPKPQPVQERKAETDKADTQLSLFDLFAKENKA